MTTRGQQLAVETAEATEFRRAAWVDDLIYAVIVLGVFVVAAIAAIVSYRHMQHLADQAGEGSLSSLFPISVDGLIIVGSMVLVDRRRRRLKTSVWAWVAVLLGVGASLAANMAGAQNNLTSVLIAAWAPVAFGICFELLLVQLRSRRRVTSVVGTATADTADTADTISTARPAAPSDTDQLMGAEPTHRTGVHQRSPDRGPDRYRTRPRCRSDGGTRQHRADHSDRTGLPRPV